MSSNIQTMKHKNILNAVTMLLFTHTHTTMCASAMNSSIMKNGDGPVPFLSLYFLFNNVNRQNFAGFASQSNCIEAEDQVSFLVKVGPNNWLLEHIRLSSMSHHWTKKRAGDHTEHKSTEHKSTKFILQYGAGHVQCPVGSVHSTLSVTARW